jgi:hypothetical protein
MMEARTSSERSVLRRATWHNIPEHAILHSHYMFSEYTNLQRIYVEDVVKIFSSLKEKIRRKSLMVELNCS